MTKKHTPGPWTSVERPGTNGAVTVATIIRPGYGRIAEAYNRADAALIALSPELLAFAERVALDYEAWENDDIENAIDRETALACHALLARVRGEVPNV